jgi:DtxR family Mn-dependent transcriptional regulator
VAEDYLKAIYKLQGPGSPVSTSALAEELGRSDASVTDMVKGLADRGLLEHRPYHGVRLTSSGESAALRIIRRHRVIESYLIEKLGYTWDGVHAEAERLEHAASDDLVDRMARAMGDPSHDPHGSPIPSREGEIDERPVTRLTEIGVGEAAVIREVADEEAERLRRAGSLGLVPGARVEVTRRREEDEGRLVVRVGKEERSVTRALAETISVERL